MVSNDIQRHHLDADKFTMFSGGLTCRRRFCRDFDLYCFWVRSDFTAVVDCCLLFLKCSVLVTTPKKRKNGFTRWPVPLVVCSSIFFILFFNEISRNKRMSNIQPVCGHKVLIGKHHPKGKRTTYSPYTKIKRQRYMLLGKERRHVQRRRKKHRTNNCFFLKIPLHDN